MNLSAYNCMFCVSCVFVVTASTTHAWDHYFNDASSTAAAATAKTNQWPYASHHRLPCHCIKLRECATITFKIRTAPKPLNTDFMKDIRKKACGFMGNDPFICCPPPPPKPSPSLSSIEILPRSFRDVTSERPWIWDIVNENQEAQKPPIEQSTNLFNRIEASSNTNAWNNFNLPRPNDYFNTMDQKPFPHKNIHSRKIHFFDFEDPHTFRNCPPSFSPDFNIPPHFQHVKPIRKFAHTSNNDHGLLPPISPIHPHSHSVSFDSVSFNRVDAEPSIVFPSRSNAATDTPSTSFPTRASTFPVEKLNLVNQENCGLSIGARIIGGTNSIPGQFPWMARIAYRNRTSQRVSYRCSGAVISNKYVLTAAHCVTNLVDDLELVYVRLGELDTRKNLCDNNRNLCSEPQDYEIESIVHHYGYDTPKYANDVALIRLRRTTDSSFISSLCLPLGNYEEIDKNLQHTTGIVVGWSVSKSGANSLPQYLQLPIVDTQSCADSYARFSANSRTPIIINEKQLCAQGTANRDTCQGDSGGPLMSEDNRSGRFVLLGLVSFGPRSCGVSSFPGVLSRTSSYVDWILNNMQL